ncbi:MAG: transglycosylase SLT domain-containing protein [Anaerolineales bacterium]|nr:transglycosylase SLT domain-containing protein [Anaerolineales bacterium]
MGLFWLAGCNRPASESVTDVLSETATPVAVESPVQPESPPTPTSTPVTLSLPAISIEDGDRARFYGDWESALLAYSNAYQNNAAAELRSAALLGMARTYYHQAEYQAALDTLQLLFNDYPAAAEIPAGHITSALVYEAIEEYFLAAEAYRAYLDIRPGLIDSYINDLRGDALVAAGDLVGAIGAYQAALSAPRLGDTLPIEQKIANVYYFQGDYNTAVVAYQDIYNRTNNDFTKATLDYLMGQAHTALGQTDQANAAYLDAVENYPLSYDTYQALILLVDAGYPVSEFDRGLVDYFAGQYTLSIAAFDRYLQNTAENAATAHYYRGMAYRALGDSPTAIAIWDEIIQQYPEADRWDDAWEEKAYTQWGYLEDFDAALKTLLGFVDEAPWHERAAEFLYDAGRVAERDRDLGLAARIWQRIPLEYPSSAYVPRAVFLTGITYYRMEDYASALTGFEQFLGTSADLGDRSAAHFWMGKAYHAAGNAGVAEAAFTRAANTDPTGYYSERARDILVGRAPFAPPLVYDIGYDLAGERAEAEAWMREVFAIPAELDIHDPAPLMADARMIRGTELWYLGLYDAARLEFESLWQGVRSNPMDNYRLVNYLLDLGFYRTAIFAARDILDLNQMDDATTMNAPIFFNHVRFGSYYRELLIPAAQQNNLHPLFLFSVVRQESLFAGWVQSSAGARGLMQIISSTGASIAAQMGWPPDYTDEDLYRPLVSITFGADYLNTQYEYFDDLYVALAAYNGGPGNAAIWQSLAGDDPDLFVEVIRFEETRRYIKGVYEIFSIYRRLYDRTP